MKLLKIVLIVILLIVMCSAISLGTGTITSGTITSGDKVITLEKAEPNSLNEWFYNLKLSEKIEIYNNYKGGK